MLTQNGTITNYVQFLKQIGQADMNNIITRKNLDLNYNTQNDIVYNFKLNDRTVATGTFPDVDVDGKSYKDDSYSQGYN